LYLVTRPTLQLQSAHPVIMLSWDRHLLSWLALNIDINWSQDRTYRNIPNCFPSRAAGACNKKKNRVAAWQWRQRSEWRSACRRDSDRREALHGPCGVRLFPYSRKGTYSHVSFTKKRMLLSGKPLLHRLVCHVTLWHVNCRINVFWALSQILQKAAC